MKKSTHLAKMRHLKLGSPLRWSPLIIRSIGSKPSDLPHEDANEDPTAVLRQLQNDLRKRASTIEKGVPPAKLRRSGKAFFSGDGEKGAGLGEPGPAERDETEKSSGVITKNALQKGSSTAKSLSKKESESLRTFDNDFLKKLSKMESDTKSPSFPTYDAAAEERRRSIEVKIKEERSKMLVFRDVGMDLDKPILSRDIFLILKYFRYGMDFAVDNELERMLRYFNEHAINELKIIQDSKLMRGPPTLSSKRRGQQRQKASSVSSGGGTLFKMQEVGAPASVESDGPKQSTPFQNIPFQVMSNFPSIRCANVSHFCTASVLDKSVLSTIRSLLQLDSNVSSFAPFFSSKSGEGKDYNAKDESIFTKISPSTFRRPAVVIFSQLGQKFGSQADEEWRLLAYQTICPGLIPYAFDTRKSGPFDSSNTSLISPLGAQRSQKGYEKGSPAGRPMSIDVVSLRSVDVYNYTWVQRLYIRRFAHSLAHLQKTQTSSEPDDASDVQRERVAAALTASSTFVGRKLLEPFYTALGLRNYLLPHVMLVDHEGVVRWLSGGCPDSGEKIVFPSLLHQLESEFFKYGK